MQDSPCKASGLHMSHRVKGLLTDVPGAVSVCVFGGGSCLGGRKFWSTHSLLLLLE